MRNCRVLHTEASTGWGGQEIRVLEEASGMSGRGHHVMIACQPGSVIAMRAAERKIQTFVLRIGGAFDIIGIRKLRALIQRQRVDIVNTHSSKDSWCAGLAARLAGGVRVIRTRHLSIPIKPNFESKLLYCTLADAVITTGESLRKHVIERTGVPPARVVSIPTGIDFHRFDPTAADGARFRAELGLAPDALLVGTVGMLRQMKGHKYFINAAARVIEKLPNARFVIVGDVAFKSDIKNILAAQMAELCIGDKVIMTGYREDVSDVMAGLDVFVLSSVSNEGFAQVVTQAMAMARPVVATNVGSVKEQVVDGQTGLLVESANPNALGDAIVTLLQDRKLARQIAENGRRLVEEKFSFDAMLDATEALYRRLLA